MFRDISSSAVIMGLLVAFAGFASSFAVVIQGLSAVGASQEEAASGLMILAVAMGLCGVLLSVQSKIPVSVAWSTPGAALLVSTGAVDGGFPVAVGGFMICALAIIISGLWKPLARVIDLIPMPLANAMLAGILLSLCLAPFKAIAFDPLLGLPILLTWVVVGAWNRLLAVPAALVAFVLVMVFGVDIPDDAFSTIGASAVPQLVVVPPEFSLAGLTNIALPLFIVTMASQNIPGIAVLKSNGYPVLTGRWFTTTGVFSFTSTAFGGHAVNLAAITAAMCAGEESHPDKDRRYWSAIVAGFGYVIFGLFAGAITAFVSLAPGILIEAVAGLALIGAFSGAAQAAFNNPDTREGAAVTFLLTASGISLFGISGAFWGLVAGGLVLLSKNLLGK
ncbi:MAG: benzoate/H(+) symporter BenE family transporter [Pseudomonadota bacterium]